ncbi:hypothetical protein SODG_001596 [Sodalis praecaptivus]
MKTVYHTTFTRIGENARESLAENMVILFREGAPEDIEAFCFIHRHCETVGELRAGGAMILGIAPFPLRRWGRSRRRICANWGISRSVSTAPVRLSFLARCMSQAPYRRILRSAVN